METQKKQNGRGLGIASMVCGIISVLFGMIPCIGMSVLPLAVVALVLGCISCKQAIDGGAPLGMAITGIVTSSFALIFTIAWMIAIFKFDARKNNLIDNIKNNLEWRIETDEEIFEATDSTMVRLGAILDSMNNPASVHFDMNANDTVVKMSITDENGKKVNMDIATRKKK
ncbi:MAG: DUF4190 domain-containing protein [Salinivirgaceae bacterium]|nr:DUF4190 domain-containing protein [Salinivirgaceae bacterium]MBR5166844.1 DUF4190 domain-containing protein [Salinivirgaceae bacterium]